MAAQGLNLGPLTEAIEREASVILDYALVLAAVGTVAMALLELIKALFRLRMRFHRYMVEAWAPNGEALHELIIAAAGGTNNAPIFYDQPTEKMLGQIQAAANLALDYPAVYPALYDFLSEGAIGNDEQRWGGFARRLAASEVPRHDATGKPTSESRDATQARSRLGNFVSRKLDAFQTKLEYWWARSNQFAAVALGASFFIYSVSQSKEQGSITFNLILTSILAGLVSPLAKDVVSALSGLRVRRG